MIARVLLGLLAVLILTAAATDASAGMNLFGIAGLTPGGLGIWAGLLGLVAWWIRGMPERKRATNESLAAGTAATTALIQHLTSEVERLSAMVTSQSTRIEHLEAELNVTKGEVTKLRAINDGQGEIRARAADRVARPRPRARQTQ